MKHLKLYEDYTDDEIRDLIGDLRSVGQALTEEEEEMLKFINQFGGGKDPEEYAEYLYDYYTNPEDYDIDTDGEYYDMICYLYEESVSNHSRYNLGGPMSMGTYDRWDTAKIANDPLYKMYIKMSDHYKNARR
jgi:hypothetical protein